MKKRRSTYRHSDKKYNNNFGNDQNGQYYNTYKNGNIVEAMTEKTTKM